MDSVWSAASRDAPVAQTVMHGEVFKHYTHAVLKARLQPNGSSSL